MFPINQNIQISNFFSQKFRMSYKVTILKIRGKNKTETKTKHQDKHSCISAKASVLMYRSIII